MKKNSVFFKENLFPNASFAKEEVCLAGLMKTIFV